MVVACLAHKYEAWMEIDMTIIKAYYKMATIIAIKVL
jgi:hypothetical protein